MSVAAQEYGWSLEYFDSPLHHTDYLLEPVDVEQGMILSYFLGDLFNDCSQSAAPREQWQRVCRALRVNGLKIVNEAQK